MKSVCPIHGDNRLEIAWSILPLIIVMGMFFWGAKVFFEMARSPGDAIEYYATGKQWMWKFQHPEGQREINQLHVPVGVPIKLTMTSEDVNSQLFCAGLPRQDGCCAGALHVRVV